jgi:quinol monooxygenase YgiN
MSRFVAIAKLHAREGKDEDARAALAEVQRSTHQEAGCGLYALHVDDSDPRAFVMIEIWDSDASLEAHIASSHVQALIAKSQALFEGPPEIQKLTALPSGDSGKGEL